MRAAALVGAAGVLAVGGCASADPVTGLDPAAADAADPTAAVADLTTVLTELSRHFLDVEPADASDAATAIVSDGATVDVAVAELDESLDLGDGARDFAAATAFELSSTADAPVAEVEIVPDPATVVGSADGGTVATVEVMERRTPATGPITETSTTYAVVLDGDRLADVRSWKPGLDSGVGLDSPTGAVDRFLALVRDGDLDAVAYFSGGVNTGTQVGVLGGLLETARTRLVELPQQRVGGLWVVYLVDESSRVLGRFEVTLAETTTVVYSPTS